MRGSPALLVTADGAVFRGRSVGASGMRTGEAVFNTSMSGYQEILTDPSYAGQVVVMTSPHIGNYGVNGFDQQSARPHLAGLVVRSMARRDSNWRSERSLGDLLVDTGTVAVSEIDTRRLTRHIRDRGAMPVAVGVDVSETELRDAAQSA
ncbi:MAG: carbamoyl phosphate synthase small subunit, partial [Acidimicrobiia bacterium]|nr:carbamoyl phosphate synthase small subunit [Acidimicrobiia bacterium]